MRSFRLRSLASSLLVPLLAAATAGCSAAPEESTDKASSALTVSPIHFPILPPGPSYSPSSLSFGTVNPTNHYEQTVWFTIAQADSFSARIANSHAGVAHITRMQAWWNAYGCYVNSPNPDCFDESLGGPGTLGVDAGEVVGVTVSIDPSFAASGTIAADLITTGGAGWTEMIPVAGWTPSCSQATSGSFLSNIGVRYNDIAFTLDSGSNIRWGWKVTSGNLQSWGEVPSGSYVDVGAHFYGPPYSIMPSTTYTIAFYPGGLSTACAPLVRKFRTARDQAQCVSDHSCGAGPGDDDGSGGGDGVGGTTLDDPPKDDPPVGGV
jgi:hypothetical protein